MSLRVKILLPLAVCFLAAFGITGFLAVNAAQETVAQSYHREMLTALGFLTRVPPPLSDASLKRMRDLWQIDLAVSEADRLVASTLPPAASQRLAAMIADGTISAPPSADSPAPPPPSMRLGLSRYRVLSGLAAGRPGPGGDPLTVHLFFPEKRLRAEQREASRRIVLAAVLGLVVLVVAGTVVVSSFTRRLRNLSSAAARIAAGEEPGRVAEGTGDELGRFAAAFNRMVDALAESRDRRIHAERMSALGQLASAVAHEVRNPLASIRMTLDLIRDGCADDETRQALDRIFSEIRRLDMFSEEILTLSGRLTVSPVEADLGETVDELLAFLKGRLDHLGVSAKSTIRGKSRGHFDPDRLRQVLMNLVLNGAHAAGSGGSVQVRGTVQEDGGFRLEVCDNGPGVPEPDRSRLFEPFFSGRKGGTGLGLSVSRRIVEAHGGRLSYGREEGWTVFAADIPGPGSPGPGPADS